MSGVTAACAHTGLLAGDGRFDDARMLFPAAYAACDEGDASGCARLAREMRDWSQDERLPEAVALDWMACARGISEGCMRVDMAEARRDPAAAQRLLRYCVAERKLVACEFLAVRDSVEAARVGCELGSGEACWSLSRMWSGAGIQVPAREFFAQRCSTTNTEACVLAGEWTSAEASSGMERLQWFDKACTAGNSSGCLRLAQAALTDGTDTGLEEACGRFGDSISAACRERSELCRLSLFCAAVAGDDAARARLRAACRDAAASQDCKLFPELRAAPPSGELQR